MLKLPIKVIYVASALYLVLPLCLWCFSWLSVAYSIIALVSLILASYFLIRTSKPDFFRGNNIEIKKSYLILIAAVIALWCLLGGQGGLLFQAEDWDARNAIYRDLITHEWPVIYEDGSALCYYFGFWLVPSLVGKTLVGLGVGLSLAWPVANAALFIWTFAGITLCFLLFLGLLKRCDSRAVVIALLMLVFFSGMDVVGMLISCPENKITEYVFEMIHIEWWAKNYQFSSMSTQLFWVFNQAIPAWLITFMIISTKTTKNDIFLGILGAFLCPLPTMGLIGIGITKLVINTKETGLKNTAKSLSTAPNLLALIPLVPVLMFMFSNQRATSSTTSLEASSSIPFDFFMGGPTPHNFFVLGLFFFLEYGIFLILLFPTEKRNPYWWGTLITLMIVNVIRMGPSGDFQMRASIPALLVLLVMLTKHLVNRDFVGFGSLLSNKNKKQNDALAKQPSKRIALTLTVCLLAASVTPLFEIVRVPIRMSENNWQAMPCDGTKTFEGNATANFNLTDYEQSRFYLLFG